MKFLLWVYVSLLFLQTDFFKSGPLSDRSFANIFSQALACCLTLLTRSYIEQKSVILMNCGLSIVSFMEHTSDVFCKNSLPYSRF